MMNSEFRPRIPQAKFVRALFPFPEDVVEVRALPSKDRAFLLAGDETALNTFIDTHRDQNLYVGVASRRDATSGKLENCLRLAALFVDLDFKGFPGGEAEARVKLDTFSLPPSIVIATGGGFHAYWLLREQYFDLTDRGMAEKAKTMLRGFAAALGGDMTAAEPARVLRLPGSLNFKYNPPRPVVAEVFDLDRRYTLHEIRQVIPDPTRPPHRTKSP